MRVWDSTNDKDDVVRFVLRRSEWQKLITALATNCSTNDEAWQGLDVLRCAEVDVQASALVKALGQILDYASDDNRRVDAATVCMIAERGLREGAPEAKEAKAV